MGIINRGCRRERRLVFPALLFLPGFLIFDAVYLQSRSVPLSEILILSVLIIFSPYFLSLIFLYQFFYNSNVSCELSLPPSVVSPVLSLSCPLLPILPWVVSPVIFCLSSPVFSPALSSLICPLLSLLPSLVSPTLCCLSCPLLFLLSSVVSTVLCCLFCPLLFLLLFVVYAVLCCLLFPLLHCCLSCPVVSPALCYLSSSIFSLSSVVFPAFCCFSCPLMSVLPSVVSFTFFLYLFLSLVPLSVSSLLSSYPLVSHPFLHLSNILSHFTFPCVTPVPFISLSSSNQVLQFVDYRDKYKLVVQGDKNKTAHSLEINPNSTINAWPCSCE